PRSSGAWSAAVASPDPRAAAECCWPGGTEAGRPRYILAGLRPGAPPISAAPPTVLAGEPINRANRPPIKHGDLNGGEIADHPSCHSSRQLGCEAYGRASSLSVA